MSSNVFTILNAVPALLGGAAPQPDTPSHAKLLHQALQFFIGDTRLFFFLSYLVATDAFT